MTPRGQLHLLPPAPAGREGWPWTIETIPPPDADQTNWPRISVVTPSYQQGDYLEECLRSVLLQNYPNLEFIVMDGGSRDGSREILARYASHLSHWQSQPDGGQAHAINAGFDRATGDIVCWLNSDDFLLPGALHRVAAKFKTSPCDLVYGDALNLHEPGREFDYWQAYWITRSFLQFGGLLASHATFWRREIHQPLWTELHCNVDGELWQRLLPGRKLAYLPVPLAVYRAHPATKSQSEAWAAKWRHDDKLVWARHGQPTNNRIFRRFFSVSQRVFKYLSWQRARAAKRAVITACGWPGMSWRTPAP